MQFSKLFDDDRAVSPVIGVILMVAITVILAAVIGTFVLGLGENLQDTSPQASFAFDFNPDAGGSGGDQLEITHETGDEIPASQVSVVVNNASDGDNPSGKYSWSDVGGSGPVSAGSSVTVDSTNVGTNTAESDLNLKGATVRVTWTSESGGSSATLAEWSGPQA